MMILPYVVLLLVAILFSAFFTLSELAIFIPPESKIRALAGQGVRGSGALSELRARPARILVMLRLGDACADVVAGALVVFAAYARWEALWLALALGVVALLILYVGELLPIGLAANHGLRFALALAPVFLVSTRILAVPLDLLGRLGRVRPGPRTPGGVGVADAEILQLAVLGHAEGAVEAQERELVERAVRLDQSQVWDIMTPRVDIFALRDDKLLRDIVADLGSVSYSRVPVYHGTIDNITGVLYLRDLYQALIAGQRDVPLKALAREPLMVPGSVPLTKLLRDFQTRRIHLAIVVDEYGGTDGLVTLEDVLEELVGEIQDETDEARDVLTRVSRHEILVAGEAELREINHFFNASFPQLEHRTFNGYLLEELGRVPEPGERIEREGIQIEVLEATDTQVTRVRLKRLATPAEPVAGVAPAEPGAGAARVDVRPAPEPEPEDPERLHPVAGSSRSTPFSDGV
jgi:CBS domain containing-hemolysin-like protein